MIRVVRYRRRPEALCGADCDRRVTHRVEVDGEMAARGCEWHAHVIGRRWRKAREFVDAATVQPTPAGPVTIGTDGKVSGYLNHPVHQP